MSWQADLEEELDWRFAELTVLKLQAASAMTGSILKQALLRALIAMLYAHYEGFCKTAIRLYLRQIKAVGAHREECLEKLTIFSLRKAFRETKSYSAEQCWQFYTASVGQILKEVVDFELDKQGEIALAGESNLYPTLLRTNLQNVCLPHAEVDTHERLLKGLVGRRNGIAHGKKLIVSDLKAYQEHEDAARDVMYGIAYAVVSALESQNYLKPQP